MLPDISSLHINGGPSKPLRTASAPISDDIEDTRGHREMEKLKEYAKSIPYAIEPYSKAIELLDFFIHRWATSSSALPSSSPLVYIRSLHMYASLDLPCGFQMQEVFHGYRQSGDAASKARVREATNTALKSLPGWPSPI